jgi:hypothetical protein
MMAIRVLCCLMIPGAGCWVPAQSEPARSPKVLEFAEVDVFADPTWTSTQVSVAGIRLGMTYEEANRQAGFHSYKLTALVPPWDGPCKAPFDCDLCERNKIVGVDLLFGDDRRVANIRIHRLRNGPNPSPPESLQWRFKGSTYQFFNNYSDDLRVKLLGASPRLASPMTGGGDSYYYSRRGLKIAVRLFGEAEKDPSLRGDTLLIVDLVPPVR